ncbi:MAG: dcm [Bacillales bacterium]|jgi:DNA (cytosine-5)-methyltransferase 1|nr:dcm [Bacillales bacterium]
MENVRGLLSSKLNEVPSEFSEYVSIKDKICFALFNAANYGVPQKRERVIVSGHRGNERIPLPKPTHSQGGEIFNTVPWITIRDAFEGLPPANEKEYISLGEKN